MKDHIKQYDIISRLNSYDIPLIHVVTQRNMQTETCYHKFEFLRCPKQTALEKRSACLNVADNERKSKFRLADKQFTSQA